MKNNTLRFVAGAAPANIAQALLRSGLSIPELRALSPLEENAQRIVDQAVVEVGLERLTLAADVLAAGLTFNLTDPLSVMEVQWERESKAGFAQRTMLPRARGENQLSDRSIKRIPVYLTTDDFSLNIRTLKASERIGTPLDTSLVKQATRRVNESIEDAAINGAGVQVGGADSVPGTCFGLLNAPNANTGALSVDWTAANVVGTTGPAMVNDVLAGISALQADFKFGPYNLYIGTKAGNVIEGDFKVNTTDTIRQRLERIQAGGRTINIRVADRMPNAATGQQMALVQMTDDVVDMVNGQAPTVIPWTSADGFVLYWMVMAIQVPRFRDDYDGNSGVYIGSKA
jgi:uncharacterized linocin/CFP29 family protein